jgi:hypothetical protein
VKIKDLISYESENNTLKKRQFSKKCACYLIFCKYTLQISSSNIFLNEGKKTFIAAHPSVKMKTTEYNIELTWLVKIFFTFGIKFLTNLSASEGPDSVGKKISKIDADRSFGRCQVGTR